MPPMALPLADVSTRLPPPVKMMSPMLIGAAAVCVTVPDDVISRMPVAVTGTSKVKIGALNAQERSPL